MSKKEQLSAKIDSEEKLAAIYGTSDPSIGSNWNGANRLERADGGQVASCPWWLRREALRITEGVYQTTVALDTINRSFASQHVVHVSNEDPTMVAYTHSTDDGLRDKQTRTTLGKFLRRTFILLTDNQIQTLEASHRAEMTGTFELATTAAAIRYTYTHMDGDSGCMRYQPLSFAIGNDRHPSEVYEAPGMGVAYTKDANGNIKSRSVVWVNPADPEDKRYVRVYGDPVLKSILVRAGYRCATLVGAKLAKIPYVPQDKTEPLEGYYVMPYLDGPGGEQADHSGAYVALEGDWFTVMPRDEREVIENALGSGYTTSARSTSARVKVLELPASEFVSDLTGEKFEGYRHRKVNYMDGDTVKTCAYSECRAANMDMQVYTMHLGIRTDVMVNNLTTKTFYHAGYWLENDTNRAACGHTRLSAHYYPDMQGWTDLNTYTVKLNGEDHIIMRGDAITLLGETEVTLVHRAETAVMRKFGFINASPDDLGGIVMISKKRATYRRSTGGTAFDTDFHTGKFVELITGGWSSKNSAARRYLFGSSVWVPQGYTLTEADRVKVFMALDGVKSADLMMASITPETEVGAIEASISVIKGTARRASAGSSFWRVGSNTDGTQNLHNHTFANITWDSQVELASFVRAQDVTGDDGYNKLEKFTYGGADVLRGTAANVETIKPWVDAHLATLKALIEQKAMEAAGQLRLLPDPPPVVAFPDERFALAA